MTPEQHAELNAFCAEKVCGFKNGSDMDVDERYSLSYTQPVFKVHTRTFRGKHQTYIMLHNRGQGSLFHPTTSPADAMAVLRACIKKCGPFDPLLIGETEDGKYFIGHNAASVEAETLELAIAKFAKALFTEEKL